MSRKIDKPKAYAWVAYMCTHAPEEMARVRKFGTPSDRLIKLAAKPTFMTLKSGKVQRIFFPVSLNTNAGQKLLFQILERVDLHLKALPIKCFELFEHVKATITHRRSDTVANLHMVAEAVIHRAACEFKTEVIFAFDSINAWITAKYGKTLGYQTLRKALELLEDKGILRVVEWGVKNNRHKATKIEVFLITDKTALNYSTEIDDWLLYSDFAMSAVYKRESVTRQDVLEQAIHSYAETFINAELMGKYDFFKSKFSQPTSDATMAVVNVVEEEVTDDYFNRLLGELVPAMSKNDATRREVGGRIFRSGSFAESRSGPAREPGSA